MADVGKNLLGNEAERMVRRCKLNPRVEQINPVLKAPRIWNEALKLLTHDTLLSSLAFSCNLRRYSMAAITTQRADYNPQGRFGVDLLENAVREDREPKPLAGPPHHGVHSSTSQLNISTFCGISWDVSVTERPMLSWEGDM